MSGYRLSRIINAAPLIFFISVLSLTFGASGRVADRSACGQCHSGDGATRLGLRDVYNSIYSYEFRHDGIDTECVLCHIIGGLPPAAEYVMSLSAQRQAVFFLKGLSLDGRYRAELRVGDIQDAVIVDFRPYDVRWAYNDHNPPKAEDIGVDEVKKRLFLEATISWNTDEPSLGVVEYGQTQNYAGRVESEGIAFKTSHSIKIQGLKPKTTYHYRVVSTDVFGNIGVSDDYVFKSEEGSKKAGFGDWEKKGNIAAGLPRVKPFRIDSTGNTYLEFWSPLPVKAYLKVNGETTIGKHGVGLTTGGFSRMDACRICHKHGISHPVGIKSRTSGVKIPDGLPTIEGGMLTCVTCHTPHGGNQRYFARFDIRDGMCEICHKEGQRL